jgi:hypothetical protein
MGTMTPRNSKPRDFAWNGNVYRVRDVWRANERSSTGVSLLCCEYATKSERGGTVWKPCIEGVEFADIEPYEKADA